MVWPRIGGRIAAWVNCRFGLRRLEDLPATWRLVQGSLPSGTPCGQGQGCFAAMRFSRMNSSLATRSPPNYPEWIIGSAHLAVPFSESPFAPPLGRRPLITLRHPSAVPPASAENEAYIPMRPRHHHVSPKPTSTRAHGFIAPRLRHHPVRIKASLRPSPRRRASPHRRPSSPRLSRAPAPPQLQLKQQAPLERAGPVRSQELGWVEGTGISRP